MQQLSANELQQVSGGTLCALGLGISVAASGAQALGNLLGACPLTGTIAQGVANAAQAATKVGGAVVNGVISAPGIAVNELGKLVGGLSCGCSTKPIDPSTPL